MAKPVGAACNLACSYCFYLREHRLLAATEGGRMAPEVLAEFIRQYIEAQPTAEVDFAWQGGEPTLAGLEFFQEVVRLQRRFADGKRIRNALQTNGTLLDDEWCAFLAEHDFLVGLSIDGPRKLHDVFRFDRRGSPSHAEAVRAAGLLIEHGVRFNTLSCVNSQTSEHPLEIYRFLKELGSRHLQFIPIVERSDSGATGGAGIPLSPPPEPGVDDASRITPWSVRPEAFGEFMIEIFEEWIGQDVGEVSVQLFDIALAAWLGQPSPVCVHAEECGDALVIESDGSVYACDHYVYPAYLLGNIATSSLDELLGSDPQRAFGAAKADTLTALCRSCRYLFACRGDCPKHRFASTPEGEQGLSYLCPAYLRFFDHVEPYMATMVQLLRAGRPITDIMEILAVHDRQSAMESAGRNDPCPCGSGRKFKHCCGRPRDAG
jgi:uncharacterized protein